MTMHRLFYALWPDEATAMRLSSLQAPLGGRRTHASDFHLTLAFLGEQPPEALPALYGVLEDLHIPPLTLALDRYGAFARLQIAWAGMSAPPPELMQLRVDLLLALRELSVALPDPGPFRPHVTLARKARWPQDLAADFHPHIWRVSRVALATSQAQADGPRYKILADRNIGTEGA